MRSACFLFLQLGEPAKSRPWLRGLLGQVTTAVKRPATQVRKECCVNIAFTAAGLARLGLPGEVLQTFPRELREGMARRAQLLGDAGESAPDRWELGGEHQEELHVLLMLYAPDDQARDAFAAEQRRRIEEAGARVVYCQNASRTVDRFGHSKEHFGFRDGISQPVIEGFMGPREKLLPALDRPVKAGELLLGYVNEYDHLPSSPSVPRPLDAGDVLADVPQPPEASGGRKDLGRNGTYLVLRKLEQDVEGFSRFLEEQARGADGKSDPRMRDWLAAKLVGRWQNGAPWKEGAMAPPPLDGHGVDNGFLFNEQDPHGLGCPVTSHVRRCNPRDSFPPGPEMSLQVTRRHRIVRRGITYDGGGRRGLVFIALNADLRRQFEFIQQSWINNDKFGGFPREKDPLVGANDGSCTFTIPEAPLRRRLRGLPQFVTTRGGGYFFMPGLRALRFLVEMK